MSSVERARTLVETAGQEAERAARAADVEIRAVGDLRAVQDVIASVWGHAQRPQDNLLTALRHAGATVAAAVRGGEAVGACFGFLGWSGGLHLHSHMTAVRPVARTAGVGYALKLWQRSECLDHGITEMRWTFDPLIRRNAYFNLAKLGVRVVDFQPDFYGEMDDIVNAGDRSDRFEVSWALTGEPTASVTVADPAAPFVALPEDFDRVRREDAAVALRWRERVHEAIAEQWRAGMRPEWDPRGGYVFHPAERGPGGHD